MLIFHKMCSDEIDEKCDTLFKIRKKYSLLVNLVMNINNTFKGFLQLLRDATLALSTWLHLPCLVEADKRCIPHVLKV